MAYDNIMKALKGPGEGLTTQQQSDNYKTFSDLMAQGVYLPDVLSKIKTLESKVEALEKPKENPLDAEIFTLMEGKVRNEPEVARARGKLAETKTRIISELCMRDEEYRRLFDEYRTIVHAHYVGLREEVKNQDRGPVGGVRYNKTGTVSVEKGSQDDEKAR